MPTKNGGNPLCCPVHNVRGEEHAFGGVAIVADRGDVDAAFRGERALGTVVTRVGEMGGSMSADIVVHADELISGALT